MGRLVEAVALADTIHACDGLKVNFLGVLADGEEGAVVVFVQKHVSLRHALPVLCCLFLRNAENFL